MEHDELKDRSVIVTGAASGIGRAAALAFAAAGARVLAVDHAVERLAETAAAARDGAITPFPADLARPETAAEVVAQAIDAFGALDALCNIAGLLRIDLMADVTPAAWDQVIAVNLRAPFLLSQAAMPHLIERSGAIVNVASIAAFKGHPYMIAYSASKGGLVSMMRSMAIEFAKTGVRINCIAPGGVATPMAHGTPFPAGVDGDLLGRLPSVRPISQPEEFTDMILFLASTRNTAIHGACLNIDAGMYAG